MHYICTTMDDIDPGDDIFYFGIEDCYYQPDTGSSEDDSYFDDDTESIPSLIVKPDSDSYMDEQD